MALPSNVHIPNAPPIPGQYGVPGSPATMALPQSAFEPPPGQGGGMGLGGTMMMQNGPGGPMQMPGGPQGPGYAQMSSGPSGFPQAQMPNGMMGPNGMYDPNAAQAFQNQGRGRGDAYPPPPVMSPIAAGVPPQQGGGKGKLIAIIGAVVAVGLLAAVITVLFLHKGPPTENGPVSIKSGAPSASTGAAVEPPPSTTPPPPPPDSAIEPTPSTSASAKPDGPKTASITVQCNPACDVVKIDGRVVNASKPIELNPGIHKFEAAKTGYMPRVENVEVKAGEPVDKVYELTALPANPNPRQTTPKCSPGQFIKKCK